MANISTSVTESIKHFLSVLKQQYRIETAYLYSPKEYLFFAQI